MMVQVKLILTLNLRRQHLNPIPTQLRYRCQTSQENLFLWPIVCMAGVN